MEMVGVLISIAYAAAGNITAARAEGMIKFAIDAFTGMDLPTTAATKTIADVTALGIIGKPSRRVRDSAGCFAKSPVRGARQAGVLGRHRF
jgi:hypothetical protein